MKLFLYLLLLNLLVTANFIAPTTAGLSSWTCCGSSQFKGKIGNVSPPLSRSSSTRAQEVVEEHASQLLPLGHSQSFKLHPPEKLPPKLDLSREPKRTRAKSDQLAFAKQAQLHHGD